MPATQFRHKGIGRLKEAVRGNLSLLYLFFPAAVFYMEIVVKMACFDETPPEAILYTGLFSVSVGLGCSLIASLFKARTNEIIAGVLLTLLTLVFIAQIVYFQVFRTFGTLYSLFVGTGAITEFWSATTAGIRDSMLYIAILLLPILFFLLLGDRIRPKGRQSRDALFLLGFGMIASYLVAFILIFNNSAGIMPVRYLYREAFVPNLSVSNFGVVTTLRLDAKYLLFGLAEDGDGVPLPGEEPEEPEEPEEINYGYNMIEIDFDALIANEPDATIRDMHEHFSRLAATRQNEYTGMFKGKNLIWFVGEAFSTLALNESITPTLSRLAKEGFVFNNFYNPVWSVSTSDGEYVTLTGLIPKSGLWSFKRSSQNYMPYGFGNLLTPLGYTCKAYHNHYYSYYNRHQSHPNLGYDYKGLGNGLKVTETWPESDLEMLQITLPGDLNNVPFHTYYMTVSGHLNYTFYGNYMAKKHKSKVEHLPYSEAAQAYLACNLDLELAVSYLIEQLTAAGELENTVIVLSGDHYPYGLTDEEMDELAGYELERKFEKYKSTLIIWSGSMKEPIEVDKVCSSLDVMPTIANLMGLTYDSRFLAGQDILSPSPGLVEFNDRSWISDLGRYDAAENVFTPNPGVDVGNEYARNTLRRVNKAFEYSAKILEYDYFRKVLK
ncbi:MAG: LTA synthase family protein [Clostridiales bacterium]|nr:LTA synthase family protein [Clostridiales bacterium]